MIYSNYDESAIDYFADMKMSGITMPPTRTCMEQNMFINGIAEAAMLNAFEKIGESERAYYESGIEGLNESVFDSIKEAFNKIIEAIKDAYEKVIAWFAEKQADVARFFREKELDRYVEKISKIKLDTANVDKSYKLCKSKIYASGLGVIGMPFERLQKNAATKAKNASAFAKKIINNETEYGDATSLRNNAAKEILKGFDVNASGNSYSEYLNNYKKKFIAEKEGDVTVEAAFKQVESLKKILLAGQQKYYIKKCFNEEKKSINEDISYLRKFADKDDKTVKSKVARCKDVIMVMDAVYRTDMDIIKAEFIDARKVLSSLAAYASKVDKRNTAAEKSNNESGMDFYMW